MQLLTIVFAFHTILRNFRKHEFTYEDKCELITQLNDLPEEKMVNVIHIVQKNKNNAQALAGALGEDDQDDDDEIELDIEALDNSTLLEIKRWLEKYQQLRIRSEEAKRKKREERARQTGADMMLGADSDGMLPMNDNCSTLLVQCMS